ncbi:MAG: hypothetical protein H0U70_02050 [Tatlockia sp.]|nr:hypothetical protein [Tatlockia sp.]
MAFLKRTELLAAAKANDLATIKSFCSLPSDEAPTEIDINDALIASTQARSINAIEYLCLSGGASQAQVSDALFAICQWNEKLANKYKLISKLCSITAENKPNQAGMDEALAALSTAGEWNFVKMLFETANPPSQKALGELLKKASLRNSQLKSKTQSLRNNELPFDVMKCLFEVSPIPPSQEDVSATLIALCKLQESNKKTWDFISYLCALVGENSPSQEAMNQVLRAAFSSNQSNNKLALIKIICSLDGENAPEQKVVSEILITSARAVQNPNVSLELIELLCEASTNHPLQADIDSAIEAILQSKTKNWKYLNYFCSLKTASKPSQVVIDKVLEAAALALNWTFVKSLCESANPPSQKALGELLKKASLRNLQFKSKSQPLINTELLPYEVLTHLFEKSVNKPRQEDISETLIAICQLQDLNGKKIWDFISYLCLLPQEFKPSQEAITQVLKAAVLFNQSNNKLGLIKTLLLLGPDQKILSQLLIENAGSTRNSYVSLEVIKLLCESSTNLPVQDDIIAAVNAVLKSSVIKWDYLSYFCSLKSPNNLNQAAIDNILNAATQAGNWPFVKTLFESDNPPSQKAVGKVLKIAGMKNQMFMIRNRSVKNTGLPYEVLTHLFESSITQPSQEDVSETLILICKSQEELNDNMNWNYISYLSDLTGDKQPSQEAMNQVLAIAVLFNKLSLVKKIISLPTDNVPTQKIVAQLLIASSKRNSTVSLEVIKILCETTFNKPGQQEVSVALENAWKFKKWNFISYFCSLETDNRPNQDAINNAFVASAKAGQWTLVKNLCLSPNSPTQRFISDVFKKAPLDLIKYIVEISLTKPSQEDVDAILLAIIQINRNWTNPEKLRTISYLCDLTEDFKPSLATIKKVLLAAVLNNELAMVKKLCLLDTDNAPNQEDTEQALAQAISLEMLQCLCELERHSPGPEAINEKLIASASFNLIEVKYLCETKAFNQETINASLLKAASFDCGEIVKYLFELEKYSFEQEIIEEALITITVDGSLETFQLIFEKLDSERQDKNLAWATEHTNNPEITLYLNNKIPLIECAKKEMDLILVIKTNELISSSLESLPQRNVGQNNLLQIATNQSLINKPEQNIVGRSPSSLFVKPKNTEKSELSKNSCFSDSQIKAIEARITELKEEMDGCCFSFFVNTDRKKEKIKGLAELLRIGRNSDLTIEEAILSIRSDKRFPELCSGLIFNRNETLFSNLVASGKQDCEFEQLQY